MNKTLGSLSGSFVTTLAAVGPVRAKDIGLTATKRLSSRLIVDKDGSHVLTFIVEINAKVTAFTSLIKAETTYDAA
jgi:hypothetical protein